MHDFAELLFGLGIFINALLAGLTYFRSHQNAENIKKLELNTNSIKDALVKVTGESEYAKGLLHGKEKG